MDIVTLIPRFPVSAKSWAMVVSKTRQSELRIAEETPSWMLRGVASQVRRRRWPFSSNLNQSITIHLSTGQDKVEQEEKRRRTGKSLESWRELGSTFYRMKKWWNYTCVQLGYLCSKLAEKFRSNNSLFYVQYKPYYCKVSHIQYTMFRLIFHFY